MKDAKPVTTSLAIKLSASLCPQTDEDIKYMSHVPYFSIIGSLMYAMVCTRPNILHTVNIVSRYLSRSGKVYWQAVKLILKYLKGTSNFSLEFGKLVTVILNILILIMLVTLI